MYNNEFPRIWYTRSMPTIRINIVFFAHLQQINTMEFNGEKREKSRYLLEREWNDVSFHLKFLTLSWSIFSHTL